MTITVRRAVPADKAEIFKFLLEAYGENGHHKFPERWEWQFERNPYKPDDQIPVFVAIDENGKIVGQSAAMYEPLKVGAEYHTLAWALDAIVLPDYRGQNLGFETLRINCESSPLWMGMIMAPSSRHILEKLGCQAVDNVSSYRRVTRFDTASVNLGVRNRGLLGGFRNKFSQFLQRLGIDKFGSLLINAAVSVQDAFLGLTQDKRITIQEQHSFDDRFDRFREKVQLQYPIIIRRDSQFLKWKYLEQPDMRYRIFTAARDGEFRGYIILRCAFPPESNAGIIADILTDPRDKAGLRMLLFHAVRFFKSQNMKYIYCASSIPAYQRAFQSVGFRKKKTIVPLLHSQLNDNQNTLLFSKNCWFLGRSDHDWDQYPYA